MKLSNNFWLSEFTRSQYASRKGIDNTPTEKEVDNLRELCYNVLQPIRNHYGKSVRVSSGFRCATLNVGIGGSKTSSHCRGEAADIEIFGVKNRELALWIEANIPEYDQLILEYPSKDDPQAGWIHVSYRSGRNRKQSLTKLSGKSGYQVGILEESKF